MVWRGAVQYLVVVDKATTNIMDKSSSLSCIVKRISGSKNIVIHKARAVCHLNHKIPVITIIYITTHPCPLRLPVKPCAKRAVMDVIIVYRHIYRCVKLNACYLMAVILMFHSDIIYFVPINLAENAA